MTSKTNEDEEVARLNSDSDVEDEAGDDEEADSEFKSKDGTVWTSSPSHFQCARTGTENAITLRSCDTSYAASRVDDIRDACLIFLTTVTEGMILDASNSFC